MNPRLKAAGASSVGADITEADGGGFVAIASNGDLDRDGERIQPGCMSPLPESIPIHLDHTMSAATVVARGRPYYSGDRLMVEAAFASTPDAQAVRTKVQAGVLDSLSIVFIGKQWETIDGVRTCVRGELLAADIVSVPSNRGARILSMRDLNQRPTDTARRAAADALLMLARVELLEAKRALGDARGPARRQIDQMLRHTLTDPSRRP